MQIIRQLPAASDEPTAVAIGNFDGVHLGHRAVIKKMTRAARAAFVTPSVLTFEPHPRRFFEPGASNFRITSLRDKLIALRNAGARTIFMPRFDAPFANMLPEEFLSRVLQRQLCAKVVVVGENFTFGQKRRGTLAMMRAWGMVNNVKIITISPLMVAGKPCSSSAVREALAAGDMATATELLGRTYRLSGHVAHGDGRGRTLGFPTANLALPADLLLPAHGVYAVRASFDGKLYTGVANIGIRPTVTSYAQPTVEVHLFDTRQDIYGKLLQVSFVTRLRSEIKFDSLEALANQIRIDCDTARGILENAG